MHKIAVYSVVVLDSISNLFFGNENVRRDVNLFIRGLREYAYRGFEHRAYWAIPAANIVTGQARPDGKPGRVRMSR